MLRSYVDRSQHTGKRVSVLAKHKEWGRPSTFHLYEMHARGEIALRLLVVVKDFLIAQPTNREDEGSN